MTKFKNSAYHAGSKCFTCRNCTLEGHFCGLEPSPLRQEAWDFNSKIRTVLACDHYKEEDDDL